MFFGCEIERSFISITPVPMFATVIVSNFETVLHDERRKSRDALFTFIVEEVPFALIGMQIVSLHGREVITQRLARTVSVVVGEKRIICVMLFPTSNENGVAVGEMISSDEVAGVMKIDSIVLVCVPRFVRSIACSDCVPIFTSLKRSEAGCASVTVCSMIPCIVITMLRAHGSACMRTMQGI